MKKLSVWGKIKLLWSPVKIQDTNMLDCISIGWFTGTVVLFLLTVLTDPWEALTIALSIYYVARFPNTSQAVFGIKPNDKENK